MRYLVTTLLLLLLTGACARVPVEEQVRALGNREFTPDRWAVATTVEREQMLASFFAKYPVDRLTAR